MIPADVLRARATKLEDAAISIAESEVVHHADRERLISASLRATLQIQAAAILRDRAHQLDRS